MRRIVTMIVLGIATIAVMRVASTPPDRAVALLTYPAGGAGCDPAPTVGMLVRDPAYGTALRQDVPGDWDGPVAWPPGATGRTVGDQVEVVLAGSVLAITGTRYELNGAHVTLPNGDVVFGVCSRAEPRPTVRPS